MTFKNWRYKQKRWRKFISPSHQALFEEFQTFLDNMVIEGRSPQTIETYRSTFLRFALVHNAVEERRVRRFLAQYDNPATRNKVLNHLKSFVRWYGTGNEFVPAPLRVRGVKVPDQLPHTIEPEDWGKLLGVLEERYPPAWAVLTIMRTTGMRIGEVMALEPEHLYRSTEGGVEYGVRFYGKGNKERIVPLPPVAVEAFRLWTGLPFKPTLRTIRNHIARAEKVGGVEHIKPHWFRSTLATRLVNNNVSYEAVAELLGHASTDILRKRYGRLHHCALSSLVQE